MASDEQLRHDVGHWSVAVQEDLTAIRARLDAQDDEIRWLQDKVHALESQGTEPRHPKAVR